MEVSKTTLLMRAHDVSLQVEGRRIRIGPEGSPSFSSDHLLAILDAFAIPRTVESALSMLGSRATGRHDWMALTQDLMALVKRGVLVSPDTQSVPMRSDPGRFDAANVHIRMLNDHARTEAFQRALRQTVRPTDVVLDIGTGTGILAATAAQAGARKVYAVEREPGMAVLAQAFFQANGVADRVEVLQGQSTAIRLPEPATVLVSETIGNDPLGEGILGIVEDARRRLLHESAIIIPQRLDVLAWGVEMPEESYGRFVFTPSAVRDWQQRYGLDFSVFADHCRPRDFSHQPGTRQVRAWKRLTDLLTLANVDLGACRPGPFMQSMPLSFIGDGLLNGFALCFRAHLGAGVVLSTEPDAADPENHWAHHVWIPGSPRRVRSDQPCVLTYEWTGRQSRFRIG